MKIIQLLILIFIYLLFLLVVLLLDFLLYSVHKLLQHLRLAPLLQPRKHAAREVAEVAHRHGVLKGDEKRVHQLPKRLKLYFRRHHGLTGIVRLRLKRDRESNETE